MSKPSTVPKTVECPYLFYRAKRPNGDIHLVKLPLVETFMKSDDVQFNVIALVDSGADRTFVQKQEADLLRLKTIKKSDGSDFEAKVIGAGGGFDCVAMTVPELSVRNNGVPFYTFRGIQVMVPKQEGYIPYSILGRDTIFKHFDITFREENKTVVFRRR